MKNKDYFLNQIVFILKHKMDKKFLCAVLLSIVALSVSAQHTENKLDEYLSALTSLKNFNGNVIISRNGKVLLDKTYNIAGAPDSMKVSRNSKFIIASVSKMFIKYAILKLVELKRINLFDQLGKFIPDFPNGDKITIEQLLYHQSGLPRELTGYENYDSLSLKKVVSLAKLERLQFEPGKQVLYSNVGYFLLHYIIDLVSPNGYLSFMQRQIFDKMKLTSTSEFNSSRPTSNFVWGFNNEDGKIVASSKKSINRFETGNYVSTVGDLYTFSEQLLSGKVLNKFLALKMFHEDSIFLQAGARPGYRAYFYMNLKNKITFIFVSNFSDIPIKQMTTDIINIVENKPYEIPHKINRMGIELSNDILKRYTGKFALEADLTQIFNINLINNQLTILEDDEKTIITPDSETTFFDNPSSKDGYVFTFNNETNKYDFSIISNGIKWKTKRIE